MILLNKPDNKDYVAEPCGRGGMDICVSQFEGVALGQFGNMQLAKMAVNMDMENKISNRKMWYKKPDGSYELALNLDVL